MLSPRLRERLSRLARGLASDPPTDAAVVSPPTPTLEAAAVPRVPPPAGTPWFLHFDPATHSAPIETGSGRCLVIEPELDRLLADHPAWVQTWLGLAGEEWGAGEGRLFVDIETAGLAAAPLFLIGALSVEGETLRLRQFFAPDYAGEAALLAHFFPWSARFERLITFNGQTFDLPYLLDRAIYHRLTAKLAQEHIDLLPLARRQWRGQLPDCRLTTLETYLCGRHRVGDVAGAEIPERYHHFVRTSNWDLLAPVLHHNALDLLTMADLAARLGG